MSFESFKEYNGKAEEHRGSTEFRKAGDYYTLAGYEALGAGKVTTAPFERGEVDTARGLRSLLEATVCYRTARNGTRAQNRAQQGISVCRDLQDSVIKYDVQRALMNEYVGDFRLVGGLEGFDDAYKVAKETYTSTQNSIGWQADPAFELNMSFFLSLSKATGHDIDSVQKARITAESLTDRVEYKRKYFPDIIENVVRESCWTI